MIKMKTKIRKMIKSKMRSRIKIPWLPSPSLALDLSPNHLPNHSTTLTLSLLVFRHSTLVVALGCRYLIIEGGRAGPTPVCLVPRLPVLQHEERARPRDLDVPRKWSPA